MDPKKVEQENLCLQTRYVIDKLRTNLFLIDDFKEFEKYDKNLKHLNSVINKIYWQL